MINEEIFPIKNAEGYFVSKSGNVYSNKKHKKSKKILKLKPMKNKHGYLVIDLRPVGQGMKQIHRIVAETFIPKTNETVNHIDGDKLNNNVSNLEWLSFYENQLHHFRVLKKHNGDDHWKTKLFSKDIEPIKNMLANGMTQKEVSKIYGVDPSLISRRISL
jgi:hypothetical protein